VFVRSRRFLKASYGRRSWPLCCLGADELTSGALCAVIQREIDAWLDQFRRFWTPHLDALATELARGKHERRKKS
jgi:hypothetical protein